ncbi:MAG TPA: hypothetical protein VG125_12655 [Pirellulales bacterium]|nr:hypothetical protein [Pirellulales bacterium]
MPTRRGPTPQIVQVVGEATAETEPGAGPVAHALAASVALATSVPIEQAQTERRTDARRAPTAAPRYPKGFVNDRRKSSTAARVRLRSPDRHWPQP